MSDYIKREDAMKPLYEKWKAAESRGDDDIAEIVKMDYITVSNVPSADVVEVVRCKDCIHNDQCKHRVVMWVEDPTNTWHKDIAIAVTEKGKSNECKFMEL